MLDPNRTAFDKGALSVFHLVPKTSSIYTDLVNKYGPANVFRGNGATDGAVLTTILRLCVTGGNYIIRLYPGTFVAGAVVTVAKIGVTIEGATDNAAATIWDCDSTDCAAFSITAAGVTLRNFSIDEPAAGVTDTISSTAVGTVVDNVIVQGGNIVSTNATVFLAGNYSVVKNCKLLLVNKGILVHGSGAIVEDNIVTGTGAGAYFGVRGDGTAAVTYQVVRRNLVFMTGATTTDGIAIEASSDLAVVADNTVFAADPLDVEADTYGVANKDLSATIITTLAYVAE